MRILLAIVPAALLAAACASAQTTWQLVWSDEFNGPAGSQPDSRYWTYDLGNNGWGNNELETYTKPTDNAGENAHMDGQGHLDIHVENPSQGVYTSTRMKTQGLFHIEYGRIEARLKMPFGQGIWPAFWMLGEDITTAGWPTCGEIDIMESIGSTPTINYGSVHAPNNYNATAQYALANNQHYSDDFHTFAIEWTATAITFFVDGNAYETVTSADAGSAWVFNNPGNPFFIILNTAVGGNWPGPPDATTEFPQDMLVDYVRVYQATTAAAPVINAGGIVDAATGSPALTSGSLASIYGPSLAAATDASLFDYSAGAFATSDSGVSVYVNGAAAPLTYLSREQINFAIPWDSLVGTPLNVEVALNGVLSNAVPIILAPAAPSVFTKDGRVALLTCPGGAPQPSAVCTLWGNGFGPTNPALLDGAPAPSSTLAWTANPCKLTIGGVTAKVDYCGGAPGLIIYQMNFVYPPGVVSDGGTAKATITVNGNTGNIVVPAP